MTIPSENSKQPVRQQAQPRCTGPKGILSPVNQALAPRDHQDCLPRSVSQNGRICHFRHHDPTWQPRGAMMLGTQGEPSGMEALGSWYSKGMGLVASPPFS